jgi:hypothetical protein
MRSRRLNLTVPVYDFDQEVRIADPLQLDNTNWHLDLTRDEEPHFREAGLERLLAHDLAVTPDPAHCAHVWPDDLAEAQCLHCNLEYEFWTTEPATQSPHLVM